jgi:asparaginyl-tRNA synthetase
VIADKDLPNYSDEIQHLFPGASIQVRGKLVESIGKGQKCEIHADSIKVFGTCDPTAYPLQKQRISFERLREMAHLRARTNTFGAIARLRNELAMATHDFFQKRGFYYLNTPIITTSDCEGAGEMFATILEAAGIDHKREYHVGARPIPLVNPGIKPVSELIA